MLMQLFLEKSCFPFRKIKQKPLCYIPVYIIHDIWISEPQYWVRSKIKIIM